MNRFYTILIAINVSEDIDSQKLLNFTIETVKIIIDKYNWWLMSPTRRVRGERRQLGRELRNKTTQSTAKKPDNSAES